MRNIYFELPPRPQSLQHQTILRCRGANNQGLAAVWYRGGSLSDGGTRLYYHGRG